MIMFLSPVAQCSYSVTHKSKNPYNLSIIRVCHFKFTQGYPEPGSNRHDLTIIGF